MIKAMSGQKGFVAILIPIILISLLALGSIFYFSNSRQDEKAPLKSTTNNSEINSLYEKGLYINLVQNVVFNYPKDWTLFYKSLSKRGDIYLTFNMSDQTGQKWYEEEYVTIRIQNDGEQLKSEYALDKERGGYAFEEKSLGLLHGEAWYGQTSDEIERFHEKFIATRNNTTFFFSFSSKAENKDQLKPVFEDLIASVRDYHKSGYELPDYFKDNITLDSKISAPSYVPNGFSQIEEKQEREETSWSYSLNVTYFGSGPNALNINLIRRGSESGVYERYIVNLQSVLNETVKFWEKSLQNGDGVMEEVNVNGYKGYFIGLTRSSANNVFKYGYLFFETDKGVVKITAGDPIQVSKEELIKIAVSMIH